MNWLVKLRYERGLTQGEVAEGSGVSRGTLHLIETRDAMPSAPIARKLADYFSLTVEQLVELARPTTGAAS